MAMEFVFVFSHLSILVLSGVFFYITVIIIYTFVVADYGELIVWGIALVFSATWFVVFLLSWVLLFRILRVCTAYEIACLEAAHTEGSPKPFNLDQY